MSVKQKSTGTTPANIGHEVRGSVTVSKISKKKYVSYTNY
jgi:hypothetical protein